MNGTEPHAYVVPPATFEIHREAAVSWFNIKQLLATAAKTIAASIIGPMSGRRELMAALDPPTPQRKPHIDLTHLGPDLWLDYMADTGDGWNATASVTWLLGRDALTIDATGKPTPQPIPTGQAEHDIRPEDGHLLLERGAVLIAGGDEVYPTASSEIYQRRLIRAFECARFSQTPARQILAIPGNHDWYDGLTAFIRLFCQRGQARRWIGAWRTQQCRSYFAARLPHGWWLWGIDAALDDDLDPPQLDYFREAAAGLEEGDRVVLCIPAPHWKTGRAAKDTAALARKMDDKLAIFQGLAKANDADGIKLILTGDLHYYARYRSIDPPSGAAVDPNHYIICGGGGAFGLGTICAPDKPVDIGTDCAAPVSDGLFPSREQSIAIRRGIWRFPMRNPGFVGLLVGLQMIALWLIGALQPRSGDSVGWIAFAMSRPFSPAGLCGFLWEVLKVLPYPALLLGTIAYFAGFVGFAISGRRPDGSQWVAGAAGAVHATLQIVGSISLVWLTAKLVQAAAMARIEGHALHAVAVAACTPVLFAWCGFLFGLYLFAGHKFLKMHDQEVFSAQGIEDFKSFLKLKVDAEGITIFPIGLHKAARRWRLAPGVQGIDAGCLPGGDLGRYACVTTPAGCERVVDPADPLAPHLIEPPIMIAGGRRP